MAIVRRKTVTVKGLPKLLVKLARLDPVVRAASGRAVEGETFDVRDDMKRGAPVKTGELRDSIQAEYDEKLIRGRAVATARHAGFVEHGTDDTRAQPFAQPAAEVSRRRFPKRAKAELIAGLKTL